MIIFKSSIEGYFLIEANLFINNGPELSKITIWENSSNKSTDMINSFSFILVISFFNKFAIHIWLIWIEQISRFALFIELRITFTFFLGIDVKKYLLKYLFLISFLGKEVNLTSKSEFSNEIGIWRSESGFSINSIASSSFISSGISINLV